MALVGAEPLDGDDLAAASVAIGGWQERTAWPSTCTVQAPQKPPPHPNFVPVRPSSSRRYQSRGMSGSPSNVRFDPLIVKVAMCPSFAPLP